MLSKNNSYVVKGLGIKDNGLQISHSQTGYIMVADKVCTNIRNLCFHDMTQLDVGGSINLTDNIFIENSTDRTKKIKFDVSGVSPNTTRIVTFPDSDITLGSGSGGISFNNVYNVDSVNGSDTNDGKTSPVKTIQKALDLIGSATNTPEWETDSKKEHIIRMGIGVYTENLTIPLRPWLLFDMTGATIDGDIVWNVPNGIISITYNISPQIIFKSTGLREYWPVNTHVNHGIKGNITMTSAHNSGNFFPQIIILESGVEGDISMQGTMSGGQIRLDQSFVKGQLIGPSGGSGATVWARGSLNNSDFGDTFGIGGAKGRLNLGMLDNVLITGPIENTQTLAGRWYNTRFLPVSSGGGPYDFTNYTCTIAGGELKTLDTGITGIFMDNATYRNYEQQVINPIFIPNIIINGDFGLGEWNGKEISVGGTNVQVGIFEIPNLFMFFDYEYLYIGIQTFGANTAGGVFSMNIGSDRTLVGGTSTPGESGKWAFAIEFFNDPGGEYTIALSKYKYNDAGFDFAGSPQTNNQATSILVGLSQFEYANSGIVGNLQTIEFKIKKDALETAFARVYQNGTIVPGDEIKIIGFLNRQEDGFSPISFPTGTLNFSDHAFYQSLTSSTTIPITIDDGKMVVEMDSSTKKFISVDSNYTITSKDMQSHQIHVYSDAGVTDINIPDESSTFYARVGEIFEIINLGTNNIDVKGTVLATINGVASFTITNQFQKITLQKINTNIWIAY